jgi:hypothetical protein
LIPPKEITVNVSKEADAVFMRELERTDPVRYANLIRNMRLAAGATSLAQRRTTGVSRRKYTNLADAQAARRQQDRERKAAIS